MHSGTDSEDESVGHSDTKGGNSQNGLGELRQLEHVEPSFKLVPRTLLSHVHGNGLQVDNLFPRSSSEPGIVYVKLVLTNRRAVEFNRISMRVEQKSNIGITATTFGEIPNLTPGDRCDRQIALSHNGCWNQGLSMKFITDKGTFSAVLKPPIGELVQPLQISIEHFDQLRENALSGMHQVSFASELGQLEQQKLSVGIMKVINVFELPRKSDESTARFAGQLSAEKAVRVLVTIEQQWIFINTDDPMLSNRLVEDLKKEL